MVTLAEVKNRRYPSYHTPLEIARTWLREGGSRRADAVELLRDLRVRYRHVLDVGNDLVLALIQAGDRVAAWDELKALKAQFREVNEETHSRWGRYYKDQGFLAWEASDLATAEECLREAAEQYEAGFAIRQGHYPGINRATLLFLLAALAQQRRESERSAAYLREARTAAAALLARRSSWPGEQPDDRIWHRLTAGEAYLLQAEWAQAAREYTTALIQPDAQSFHRSRSRAQATRILAAWAQLGIRPEGAFDLDAVFGVDPSA
jgi:hypothetical protein